MTRDREVLSSILARIIFFEVSIEVVGVTHKQLREEAYYNVIINAPIAFLILNRLMVGRENKHSNKK